MTDDPIHIAFATDGNFIHYTTVALYSVLANTSRSVKATILYDGVSDEERESLLRSCRRFGAAIEFVLIEPGDIDDLPVLPRMSRAAYFRLLLPKILGEDIEKVLYLDSDILCVGDIAPLWDTDISAFMLGAVRDLVEHDGNAYPRLVGYFPTALQVRRRAMSDYFNSGVILMNLRRWRSDDVSRRALDWIRRFSHLSRSHDQDALNAIVDRDWFQLSARWNFGSWFLGRTKFRFAWAQAELRPIVIHFAARYLFRPYRAPYGQYVSRTEWANSGRRFFAASRRERWLRAISWRLRHLHVAFFPALYGPPAEFGEAMSPELRSRRHPANIAKLPVVAP